ncbi:MAG: hypothetical protein QXJ28_01010 [Candidatus Pacearchaeota archaeon]
MPRPLATFQVGKSGVSENLINSIKLNFKNSLNVRVVFLKSFSRDKDKIRSAAEEIVSYLGSNYTFKIVGFTIFIKKWRKSKSLKA